MAADVAVDCGLHGNIEHTQQSHQLDILSEALQQCGDFRYVATLGGMPHVAIPEPQTAEHLSS